MFYGIMSCQSTVPHVKGAEDLSEHPWPSCAAHVCTLVACDTVVPDSGRCYLRRLIRRTNRLTRENKVERPTEPLIEGTSSGRDSPTVEVPAQAITDDPALKNYRTPEVVAICKAQQNACEKEARKISARNLERELQREKRLGVESVAFALQKVSDLNLSRTI
jgi:hypothetical protein